MNYELSNILNDDENKELSIEKYKKSENWTQPFNKNQTQNKII